MSGRPRCAAVATAALLTGAFAAPAKTTAGPTASAVPASVPTSAASTTTITDLGMLPGGTNSYAVDINASGQVTGDANTAVGQWRAFRWTVAGGMQDLGTLDGPTSTAAAINDLGQVTGYATTAGGQWHAFRWSG